MAIDLRQVEPLGSKSVLLEQAKRRQKEATPAASAPSAATQNVKTPPPASQANMSRIEKEIEESINQLLLRLKQLEEESKQSRVHLEREQQLLFKQIKTLNALLKKQVDLFNSMDKEMADMHNPKHFMQSLAIGVVAGLASALTIFVTAPWLTSVVASAS
ncbi:MULTISPECIES: hypothetical protein [Thiomicrorhabdus]|uniref:Uncharacterized protein n=1 Tax=Thiomicrorhabdus heinhorstiae TaxID=2748010 RepID=A0ABS0BUW8_9GAMM|nr:MULTISPECIES: hypothetical protein [Thiomicrorhabdus]MBF6057630.1 hypothetical protein [Thiomicrorhabdus heinhorstiae]